MREKKLKSFVVWDRISCDENMIAGIIKAENSNKARNKVAYDLVRFWEYDDYLAAKADLFVNREKKLDKYDFSYFDLFSIPDKAINDDEDRFFNIDKMVNYLEQKKNR